MKKLLLLLFATIPSLVFAQNTEGKITYTQEVKFQVDLPEGMEHLKDKLPSSQKSEKELLFNQSSSLWHTAVVEENEDAQTFEDTDGERTVRFKMRTAGGESELFKNLENNQQVEKTDFMGKTFLIDGNLKKYPWKLSEEKKTVAGYDCQKAVYQDEEQKVEAWYTSQIPVSSGPNEFGSLPGMILEINVDDGQTLISASKVDLKELEEEIVAPKKGKKMSREEYDAMVEAKTKEMQEEMGGNTMRLRIRQ